MIPQHPKNIDKKDSPIIDYFDQKPVLMTIPGEVTMKFFETDQLKRKIDNNREEHSKIIETAIIGPPNSGKSTLINKLLGQKVTAVSKLSHTTNTNTLFAKTFENEKIQLVYNDTPGLVPARTRGLKGLDRNQAWLSIQENDLVILVVDVNKRLDDGIIEILNRLKKKRKSASQKILKKNLNNQDITAVPEYDEEHRVVLVLNKVDLCLNKRRIQQIKDEIEDFIHFEKVFIVSAKTGFGIEMLEEYLKDNAEPGMWRVNPNQVSLRSETALFEELIRNALYDVLYKEIPHRTTVRLEKLELLTNGLARVHVRLFVKSRVQRGMVIGRGSKNLNKINKIICKNFNKRYGLICEASINISTSTAVETNDNRLYAVSDEDTILKGIEKNLQNLKKKEE